MVRTDRMSASKCKADVLCTDRVFPLMTDTVENLKNQLATEFREAPIETDIWQSNAS